MSTYMITGAALLAATAALLPAVDAFVEFALSPEGQTIVDETFVPYIPLGQQNAPAGAASPAQP